VVLHEIECGADTFDCTASRYCGHAGADAARLGDDAIMREKLMNRTTLDVLLVVLLLAWVLQPLPF
jgi:hypothetical protein